MEAHACNPSPVETEKDCYLLKANLGYIARPCLKNKNKNNNKMKGEFQID